MIRPLAAALAVLCTSSPAPAQLFADFSTSLGEFTVELDHQNAPRTVARFVKHANGDSPWFNDTSNETMSGPFYDGLQFHRAVNGLNSNQAFKIIQTGSRNAEGRRTIGYILPDDEVAMPHRAYVLSMANRGPNTNSSEIFLTGDEPIPSLDTPARHTVFGQVPASDEAGRATVDAIVDSVPEFSDSAPDPPVILNSVTIRRENDVIFDENAQGVPVVSTLPFAVRHEAGEIDLLLTQPPHSSLRLYHGNDLQSWERIERYFDGTVAPTASWRVTDLATGSPQYFFLPTLITYADDAIFPSDFESRTISMTISTGESFVFTFGSDGNTGNWSLDNPAVAGDILETSNTPDGYGTDSVLRLSAPNFSFPWFRFRLGIDSANETEISGRLSGRFARVQFDLFAPTPLFGARNVSGTFTLTRQ